MKQYSPICKCDFGKLSDKVNLEPDFFTGFDPKRRNEIVAKEADFYHGITAKYSVDDKLVKEYITVKVRDGEKISVKVYKPKNASKKLPGLVFIHGGGFITCSVETHDFIPSYIAANVNCICFSIEYRLAPEYPFPVGIEDCFDVSAWIFRNAEELGIDNSRISVAGDSSGGNFAAVLAQMAKKTGLFSFYSQILIYPVTDISGTIQKESVKVYARPNVAPDPDFVSMYLPKGTDFKDSMISPLFAESLAGLPKALFIEAECDSLCSDGLYYAKALRDSGVSVSCHIYKGMPHAFVLRTYEETFEALNEICFFIRD